jgi:hypothetical protein
MTVISKNGYDRAYLDRFKPVDTNNDLRMALDALPILAAAAPLGVWGVLWDILVLLAMALLLGTVAERLGKSVIVGYLWMWMGGCGWGQTRFAWMWMGSDPFCVFCFKQRIW